MDDAPAAGGCDLCQLRGDLIDRNVTPVTYCETTLITSTLIVRQLNEKRRNTFGELTVYDVLSVKTQTKYRKDIFISLK